MAIGNIFSDGLLEVRFLIAYDLPDLIKQSESKEYIAHNNNKEDNDLIIIK